MGRDKKLFHDVVETLLAFDHWISKPDRRCFAAAATHPNFGRPGSREVWLQPVMGGAGAGLEELPAARASAGGGKSAHGHDPRRVVRRILSQDGRHRSLLSRLRRRHLRSVQGGYSYGAMGTHEKPRHQKL